MRRHSARAADALDRRRPTAAAATPARAAFVATVLAATTAAAAAQGYMAVDGSGHNTAGTRTNAAGAAFQSRRTYYAGDGSGATLSMDPNPRAVSNGVFASPPFTFNSHRVSSLNAAFGQFVAHDLIMTSPHPSADEVVRVPAPRCDATYDATCAGNATLTTPFKRCLYDTATGSSPANPRRQLNKQTGWLDASTVYGTSAARLVQLRAFFGGLLLQDDVNGVPRNFRCAEQAGPFGAGARRKRVLSCADCARCHRSPRLRGPLTTRR